MLFSIDVFGSNRREMENADIKEKNAEKCATHNNDKDREDAIQPMN